MFRALLFSGALLAASVDASPPHWPQEHDWNQWGHHGHKNGWWPETSKVYIPPGPPATRPGWPYHHTQPQHGPPHGHPTPTATTPTVSFPTASPTDPCAIVRDLQATFTSASPSATATVPAELAYKCINSVPFNSSAAVALLDSIRPYVNWQTTVQWLKDPPAEYAQKIQPPYDFWAHFEQVYADAKSGSYANEYEFGFDLYRAFQMTHDGHFVVYPDSVTGIFTFGRTTPLVSVSVDGTSIPEVYMYSDLMETLVGGASFTPSPLTMIDGQNSTEFLLNWSTYGSLQDQDALWNNMFYLLGQVSLGAVGTGPGTFAGGGRGRNIYPGPSTTITFANGSTVTNENFARVLVDFTNVTSGADIYSQFFTVPADQIMSAEEMATSTTTTSAPTPTPTTSTAMSTSSSTTVPAPGFPSPVVREKNNLNGGYFLDGEGYEDVAVLNMASFVGAGADEIPFQAVNTYFLQRAVAAKKTKLIVDVSANGGGTILQGYDIFKQLFPSILPYGASRYRAHEALDYIGQEASDYSGLVPRTLDLNDTALNIVSSFFNYRTDDDVNYKPFPSWASKYGPATFGPGPDNYTSIIRWNLSDVLTPSNSGGIDISGYLNRTNITAQPFAAENIVVLTDGYCASTCTIFSELLRQQTGVQFVNLGGRPNRAPTQAIGGVKGTNDLGYADILFYASVPFMTTLLHDAAFYAASALKAYTNLPLFRLLTANINVRDGFQEGDVGADSVPLQFRYEEAACRLYYTPEMAVDQSAAWKTVADAAWGVGGVKRACVAGKGLGKRAEGEGLQRKHAVRADVDLEEHRRALVEVWTGKGGVAQGGEGLMVV